MASQTTATVTPWSKQHKRVTRASAGGLPHNLSNSYANPLRSSDLLRLARERGDGDLADEYLDHGLGYTPNGGSGDLRAEIAEHYGEGMEATDVLVFPGAQVALQTVAQALVGGGGGHCITFSPGYQSIVQGPLLAGGRVTAIPLHAENGWQVRLPDVEAAIEPDTRAIWINEPYNPAGTLMAPQLQADLIDLADRHGLAILSDEVYRMLEHDPSHRLPAMASAYSRGISVVTLSKPWGACGITIGWAACRNRELLGRIADAQYFGTACPSRASEIQAMMVLRASDVILDKNLGILRRNLSLLEAFVARYRDLFAWVKPRAGAIAALRFLGPMTSAELGKELAGEGISIKPAYCFADGASVEEERDYFRVGFGEEVMPAALEALRTFVEARKEEWRSAMTADF